MNVYEGVRGVVLAGGEGKRLRPLSYYFQKCMIPVGKRQKPLLEYVIRLLRFHGVQDISLLVGYKCEQIRNYFEDGTRFGVRLTYLEDEPSTKGTGSALLKLREGNSLQGPLLVYYGDILSNVDLGELLDFHRKMGADATLALARGYQVPVGVAEVDGGKVKGWVEKPTLDLHAGIGVLVVESRALNEFEGLGKVGEELDITKDFVSHMVKTGRTVCAYVTDRFWYDVGTTERYEKLDNGAVEKNFNYLFGY